MKCGLIVSYHYGQPGISFAFSATVKSDICPRRIFSICLPLSQRRRPRTHLQWRSLAAQMHQYTCRLTLKNDDDKISVI